MKVSIEGMYDTIEYMPQTCPQVCEIDCNSFQGGCDNNGSKVLHYILQFISYEI